jgi:hypothetical protein
MIEIISGLPDGVLGFTARGKVTGNDEFDKARDWIISQ